MLGLNTCFGENKHALNTSFGGDKLVNDRSNDINTCFGMLLIAQMP